MAEKTLPGSSSSPIRRFSEEDPHKVHEELRAELDRTLSPLVARVKDLKKRYHPLNLMGLTSHATTPQIGWHKTLCEENESLQRKHEICKLENIIRTKQKSLLKAAQTAFVLQIAGYIALAVAPILGLSIIGWAALPLLIIGFGLYFASWHFAERRDSDQRDLEVHETELARKKVLVEADKTYAQEALERSPQALLAHVDKKSRAIEALDLATGPHNQVSFWVNNLAPERVYFRRPTAA